LLIYIILKKGEKLHKNWGDIKPDPSNNIKGQNIKKDPPSGSNPEHF